MLEIHSSNPPVVIGICDPNKSRARHHSSLKLGSKLKYVNITQLLEKISQNPQYTQSRQSTRAVQVEGTYLPGPGN